MRRRAKAKALHRVTSPLSRRHSRLPLLALPLASGIVLALAVAALLVADSMQGDNPPGMGKAAIVDQLSLTEPNAGFVRTATQLLEDAHYEVDYYAGQDVTVDFYRRLPLEDYKLVILRTHSGRGRGSDTTMLTDDVSLFTSEPYSRSRYVEEQKAGSMVIARYLAAGGDRYFGIPPSFIGTSVKGRFDGALVIMMGCDGLRSPQMGQAFLDKGASAYVGWSTLVSAPHTDAATERLLQNVLVNGLPIGDAVATTANEIGPDPAYGAELRFLQRTQ